LRSPAGTIVAYSGRGSQFRSAAVIRTLRSNGLTGSMGRAGVGGDNAAMESFFALLQENVLNRRQSQQLPSRQMSTIRKAIVTQLC
jgi:putative transposase